MTVHKVLIRCPITYACLACGTAAEIHLLKLHQLHNKILRTVGKLPRGGSARDMHAFPHSVR
jgi:hypothetical protein